VAWRKSVIILSLFYHPNIMYLSLFEQNRQSYEKLFVPSKDSSKRLTGKGRGKGADISLKDATLVAGPEKDKVTIANEMLKAFSIRFVHLNGILFTRTR
jgi:protein SMG7